MSDQNVLFTMVYLFACAITDGNNINKTHLAILITTTILF